MSELGLVCVGGGAGARFGGDKLTARIVGRTLLEHSLSALREAFPDAKLLAVLPSGSLDWWRRELAERQADASLVVGGARRQDSVRLGVEVAAELGCTTVAVHDAARPAVHPEDVRRAVDGLADADGTVLCGLVADTVKEVDAAGAVVATLDRQRLRLALTPQVFRVAALQSAWKELDDGETVTDESTLLERLGMRVTTVEASRPNPKVTVPADLSIVQVLLAARCA